MTEILTQAQAAALAGLTTRRLRQLSSEDDPPPQDLNGQYPAREFGEWLRRRHLSGLTVIGSGETLDYNAERARLTKAQADKTELEVEVLRGSLIPAEKVEEVWGGMLGAFRARCLSIPTKAAHAVLAADDLADAEAILKNHIHEALAELADYDASQYSPRPRKEDGEDGGAAAGDDSEPVGGRPPKAQQRGKRRTRPVEH